MPPENCPLHPGEVISKRIAKWKRKAKIKYLARITGASPSMLSRVMNRRAAVGVKLALCLAKAFHVSAESWLRMQASYDLWHARRIRRRGGKTVPFVGTLHIRGRIRGVD
jgi:addiction module HigA family antidote